MTKKQIFGFKPTPQLEQISDEYSERAQNRNHHSQ
jgi:hypothetical protein